MLWRYNGDNGRGARALPLFPLFLLRRKNGFQNNNLREARGAPATWRSFESRLLSCANPI
jgi:hypothetical protein